MTDLLQRAAQWLAGVCRGHMAHEVTYQRDQQQAVVPAVVGQTDFDQTNEYGVVTSMTSRDFLIAVSDLLLDGQPIEPARGDRIVDGEDTYEVMAPGDEPPWRFADPYHQMYRIHTKRIA